MSSNPNKNKPREWGDVESLGGHGNNGPNQMINVGERITDIYTTRDGRRSFQNGGNSWTEKEAGSGEFHMASGQGGGGGGGDGGGGGMGYQAPVRIKFGNFDDKKPEKTGPGKKKPKPGTNIKPDKPVTGLPTSGIVGQGPVTMQDFTPISIDPATGQPQHLTPLVDPSNWLHQTNPLFQVPESPGTYVSPGILDYLKQITSGG